MELFNGVYHCPLVIRLSCKPGGHQRTVGGLMLTTLSYIYAHILYLVVGSSGNVLSSTRTRTCTQLGPGLVIRISLTLFLPNSLYSDSILTVTGSPLTLHCSKTETGHLPPHGLSLSPSTMSEYILQEQHYIAPNLRDRQYCSIRLSYLYTVRTSSTMSARWLPA